MKGPDGKALSYTPHEPPTPPDPAKDFTILKPGESVTKELGSGYLHLSALQWPSGGATPMARGKYR